MNVKTYSEKERRCNASFLSAGPYWHAYTSGKETPLLFSCTQDFAFAMNVVAQASNEFKGVTILAFEILNNHFQIGTDMLLILLIHRSVILGEREDAIFLMLQVGSSSLK